MSNRPSAQAVPNPYRRLGAYLCPARGDRPYEEWFICGERFVFRSSYEDHWLREHAAVSLSREHGPELAQPHPSWLDTTLRYSPDAVVGTQFARGGIVQPAILHQRPTEEGQPMAEQRSSEDVKREPFDPKDGIVMIHGKDWAPEVINVSGVKYVRADLPTAQEPEWHIDQLLLPGAETVSVDAIARIVRAAVEGATYTPKDA